MKVYGPESSLIPKQFIKKKFKFMKNALVDSRIGAAENTRTSHSSNPKLFLILLKITFLAILHPNGVVPPLTSAYVPKFCTKNTLWSDGFRPINKFSLHSGSLSPNRIYFFFHLFPNSWNTHKNCPKNKIKMLRFSNE